MPYQIAGKLEYKALSLRSKKRRFRFQLRGEIEVKARGKYRVIIPMIGRKQLAVKLKKL